MESMAMLDTAEKVVAAIDPIIDPELASELAEIRTDVNFCIASVAGELKDFDKALKYTKLNLAARLANKDDKFSLGIAYNELASNCNDRECYAETLEASFAAIEAYDSPWAGKPASFFAIHPRLSAGIAYLNMGELTKAEEIVNESLEYLENQLDLNPMKWV